MKRLPKESASLRQLKLQHKERNEYMADMTKNPAEKPLKKGAKNGTKKGIKNGAENAPKNTLKGTSENTSENPSETALEETFKEVRMDIGYGSGCIAALPPIAQVGKRMVVPLLLIPTEEEYNVEMDVVMDRETNENKILVTLQGGVWLKNEHPELDLQTETLEDICNQFVYLLNDAMTNGSNHTIPFDLWLHAPCESTPDMEVTSPDGYVDLVFEDCKLDIARLSVRAISFANLSENVTKFCDLEFVGDNPTTARFTLKIPFIHNGDVILYGARSLTAEDPEEVDLSPAHEEPGTNSGSN